MYKSERLCTRTEEMYIALQAKETVQLNGLYIICLNINSESVNHRFSPAPEWNGTHEVDDANTRSRIFYCNTFINMDSWHILFAFIFNSDIRPDTSVRCDIVRLCGLHRCVWSPF